MGFGSFILTCLLTLFAMLFFKGLNVGVISAPRVDTTLTLLAASRYSLLYVSGCGMLLIISHFLSLHHHYAP